MKAIEEGHAEVPEAAGETASPATDAPQRRFRGDIDGLRAIAIALVVAYHVDLPGISGGFIGVDVFFVISGYLITRNLLVESDRTHRVALVAFWARRIRRLVPAMTLMIVATLVASFLILPRADLDGVAQQGGAAALYLSNVLFARELGDYFAGDVRGSPFLHTWSLGVEEQFYLLWPLVVGGVVALVRRRTEQLRLVLGVVFALVLVVSFAWSLQLTSALDPWAFYGLQSRAWEFAVAGLLALATVPRVFERPVVRTASAVAGLAIIVVTAVTLTGTTPYPGAWALLPVLGTVLVILAGSGNEDPVSVVRGLAAAPARWLGRVSYSWYLWHWPFIILFVAQLGDSLAVKLAAGAVSLGVATAGHHYVENPVRFSPSLTRSWRRTFAMGAALTVAAVLVAVAIAQLGSRTGTDLDRLVAQAEASRGDEVCSAEPKSPSGIELCISGDRESKRTILVIGDSHARHWSTALDEVGRAEGFRIIGRWLGSCPPLDINLTPSDTGQAGVDRCNAFRADTIALLDELKPDGVIVSQANFYEHRILADDGGAVPRPERPALWGERFGDFLGEVTGRGIPLGVIRDNPQLPTDPIECLGETNDIDACSVPRAEVEDRTASIRAAETAVIEQLGDIPQMSTTDVICDAQQCRIADDDDGFLRYYDAGHLTAEFTRSQADQLAALLEQVVAAGS